MRYADTGRHSVPGAERTPKRVQAAELTMPKLRHPLTGGIYESQDSGLVRVEENGKVGLFHPDGVWHSGELRQADPHMAGWVGGPQVDSSLPGSGGRARAAMPPSPTAAAPRNTTPPPRPCGRRR